MASRVVLHIGLLKSGTTYVQQRMLHSWEALAEHGVLFPGRALERRWRAQVCAVADLLRIDRRPPGYYDGMWKEMVEEIAEWDGTAILSMEFLCWAPPEKIQEIVDAFAPVPVEVVVTARDLGRTLPAMWQEEIKNAHTMTMADYLRDVRSGEGDGRRFWDDHALDAILQRWVDGVGAEHVTLVTVPPPGADSSLLWTRYCEAVGMPTDVAVDIATMNESLGAASVEVMRRLNLALAPYELPWERYAHGVKDPFATKILAGHRRDEQPIGLKAPRWLRQRAKVINDRVAALPIRVIGDVRELTPVDVPGVDPAKVSVDARFDAAVAGLAGLLAYEPEQ